MKNKFESMQIISKSMNETGDCSVKAIAVACNVPYKVAHKALQDQGRKPRQGVTRLQINKAIVALGFKVVPAPVPKNAKTIITLGRSLPSRGRFLAYTHRHVAGCAGGLVHDWTDGRRHRITTFYRITKKTDK